MNSQRHSNKTELSRWTAALGLGALGLLCATPGYGAELENVDFAFLTPTTPAAGDGPLEVTSISKTVGQRVADVPTPGFSTVEPWDNLGGPFLAPSSDPLPASLLKLTIRNSINVPIPNANVVIQFRGASTICAGTVLTGITDGNGYIEMPIYGGDCVHQVPMSCIVRANGLSVRRYENAKSPDFDGIGSNGSVDLGDLLEFKKGFLQDQSDCHDYNNDGDVGLSDLILFGAAFTSALTCP